MVAVLCEITRATRGPELAFPQGVLAQVHAAMLEGIEAQTVRVEVTLGKGLPGFEIVGLPEAAVRESRVRVKSALEVNGFVLPPRSLVVNLAPADLRKTGSSFDLAIAVAVLVACGASSGNRVAETLWVGELGLGGDVRAVRGVLPQLLAAVRFGLTSAIVPVANAREAEIVSGLDVRVAAHLSEVVAHLQGTTELPRAQGVARSNSGSQSSAGANVRRDGVADLSDVRGQATARRALEVAAAGGHALLLLGPPGSGKTMLARRLPGILPAPTNREMAEIATIASAAALPGWAWVEGLTAAARPFRAPHHSVSAPALLGGGAPIRPGEVTLAHRGVLFLDELPEFRRDALEALRTTLESGEVVVVRMRGRARMPARPLLVAAMNPCPCGYASDSTRLCTCPPEVARRYAARISGPLLDRFDMQVVVPRMPSVRRALVGDTTEIVRRRVVAARAFAASRNARENVGARVPELARLIAGTEATALALADTAVERLGLSARGYVKALRVARTIADLGEDVVVREEHVAEALQYRAIDRQMGSQRGGSGS